MSANWLMNLSSAVMVVAFWGAMLFAPLSAVLAARGRYRGGIVLGISSVAFELLHDWLWFGAFARKEGGAWFEIAYSASARGSWISILILVCGVGFTAANILCWALSRRESQAGQIDSIG